MPLMLASVVLPFAWVSCRTSEVWHRLLAAPLRHRVKCSIKEGHVNPLAVAGCHHCLVRSLFHFETLSELIEINPESR